MAEKQNVPSAVAGELTQRFVQFVSLQFQNTLFVLGLIPTPDGQRMAPHLGEAKMFIDNLEMIREKTRGNLNSTESQVLENALGKLRMAFTEASGGTPPSMMPSPRGLEPMPDLAPEEDEYEDEPAPELPPAAAAPVKATSAPAPAPAPAAKPEPTENKKKFSKTYG
ncbi:MAG: DUF1844 domain-containing protein [Candidatus Methylacidiphilales bacterium]|nr:DUF1844 domain-containing protein [Candidatus Methylacidiphilales bacterium]